MEKTKIIKALDRIKETPEQSLFYSIGKYEPAEKADKKLNQFIVFLKPEALSSDVEKILDLLFKKMEKFSVKVDGASVLSGAYLKKYHIIDRHYGVLNSISRNGVSVCSSKALERVEKIYGKRSDFELLGGHQFLDKFQEFTPFSLCTLNDNLGTQKLGSGTYSISVEVFQHKVIILNGFHPYQLEHLTEKGKALVAFACSSYTSWKELRANFIGTINPKEAALGSFRKTLFDEKEDHDIQKIDVAHNHIHISPGPLEGHLQIIRFLNDFREEQTVFSQDTNLGLCLDVLKHDWLIETVERNPELIFDNKIEPLFDYTEDMESEEFISLFSREHLFEQLEETGACK